MNNNTPIFIGIRHIRVIRDCSQRSASDFFRKIKRSYEIPILTRYITLEQYLKYVNENENKYITKEHVYEALTPKQK